jgi:serine/threonine protein kinase
MRNSSPVVFGEIIADKYQVESVIGEGGMGLVVSAWHLGLRQRVAIKFLLSDGGIIEQAALERFQREARAAARIRSEHVCRVIDVGLLPGGAPYLVLEYLEGCDLADELARRGRLPAAEAVGYVLEACEALAEAHVAGIIHRDLKPANLFLASRPNGTRCLKLLDFGVSKSIAEGTVDHFSLTKTSSIIGSPIYMSPEQLNSAKDVDGRTDIWALGALTYELLTGRPPFYGETIPQLVSQVLHADPPTFAELGVTAPGGLEIALRKALSKSREQRYANVGEFATALGPYAPDDSISVSRILRIRPSEREPLPETIDERDLPQRDLPRTPRTPRVLGTPRDRPLTPRNERATPRSERPLANAASTPTDPVPRRRRPWGWALLGALVIALAGVLALISRQRLQPDERVEGLTATTPVDAGGPFASGATSDFAGLTSSKSALLAPTEAQAAQPEEQPVIAEGLEVPETDAGSASVRAPFGATQQRATGRARKPVPTAVDADKREISDFGGRR